MRAEPLSVEVEALWLDHDRDPSVRYYPATGQHIIWSTLGTLLAEHFLGHQVPPYLRIPLGRCRITVERLDPPTANDPDEAAKRPALSPPEGTPSTSH